jgi:hypothetical protein
VIGLLLLAACSTGADPVLLAINDASYSYDVTGALRSYIGINLLPGETLDLTLEVRHTREIHFANMPGIVTFDPAGTTGTLEVFDGQPDTGDGYWPEGLVTLTNAADRSRDFPVSFSFPRDSGDTGR